MSVSPRRRHIAGLDGLRAIAAIMVLVYHLVPGSMGSGFLGVDVFFVISGWLITALLLDEHTYTGRINFWEFWKRRMRRLMPALAVVVLVCVPVAYFVHEDAYVGLKRQLLGVFTYSYNWLEIGAGNSYFDRDTPKLFTNVWSLAVEEQFYVLWPLLVIILLMLSRAWRFVVPALLGVASITACAYIVTESGDISRAHLGTDTHIFGMMLGALTAFAMPGITRDQVRTTGARIANLRAQLSWVALLALLALAIFADGHHPFMYPWGLLLASLLTILVLQGFAPEVVDSSPFCLTKVLDNRLMKWLGDRSYGLYLWHWPVWVIVQMAYPDMQIWISASLSAAITVVGAAWSYRFVESPIRAQGLWVWMRSLRIGFMKVPRVFAVIAASVALIITVFAVIHSSNLTSTQRLLVQAENSANVLPVADQSVSSSPTTPKKVDFRRVTVIGDSVALASRPALLASMPGCTVDASVSRAFPTALGLIARHKSSGTLGSYVVLALASNGEFSVKDIEKVSEAIGPERHLILVTGFGPQRTYWIPPTNKNIFAAAAAHPEKIQVAAWHTAIAKNRGMLASDYVHPGPAGARIYARTVKAAVIAAARKH